MLLLNDHQEVIYKPQKALERAKRLMPNLEASFVPSCEHHIPTEQPGFLNKRVLAFLRKSE